MAAEPAQTVVETFASKLRYPQLFFVLVVLFLINLFVWDPIPLLDEIILGLLAVLAGRMRAPRAEPKKPEKPPMKDVTPPGGG